MSNRACAFVFVFSASFPPRQVVRRLQEKLGLQESKNTFALYEQNSLWERPVAGGALIADILTRFEKQMPSSACKTAQTATPRSPDAIKPMQTDTLSTPCLTLAGT